MKNVFLVLIGTLVLGVGCARNSENTPPPPAEPIPTFKVVFEDRLETMVWSQTLPGTYSHGCHNKSGNYSKKRCSFIEDKDGTKYVKPEDSDAARACEAIGGRLPTVAEYQRLATRYLVDTSLIGYRSLREGGREALKKLFGGDLVAGAYWTANVRDDDPQRAITFSPSPHHFKRFESIKTGPLTLDSFFFYDFRARPKYDSGYVRCVQDL